MQRIINYFMTKLYLSSFLVQLISYLGLLLQPKIIKQYYLGLLLQPKTIKQCYFGLLLQPNTIKQCYLGLLLQPNTIKQLQRFMNQRELI